MRQTKEQRKEEALVRKIASVFPDSDESAFDPSELKGISLESLLVASRIFSREDGTGMVGSLSYNPKMEDHLVVDYLLENAGISETAVEGMAFRETLLNEMASGSKANVMDLVSACAAGKLNAQDIEDMITMHKDKLLSHYAKQWAKELRGSPVLNADAKKLGGHITKVATCVLGVGVVVGGAIAVGNVISTNSDQSSVEHARAVEVFDELYVAPELIESEFLDTVADSIVPYEGFGGITADMRVLEQRNTDARNAYSQAKDDTAKLEALVAAYPNTYEALVAKKKIVFLEYLHNPNASQVVEEFDEFVVQFADSSDLTTSMLIDLVNRHYSLMVKSDTESSAAMQTLTWLNDLHTKTEGTMAGSEIAYIRAMIYSGETEVHSLYLADARDYHRLDERLVNEVQASKDSDRIRDLLAESGELDTYSVMNFPSTQAATMDSSLRASRALFYMAQEYKDTDEVKYAAMLSRSTFLGELSDIEQFYAPWLPEAHWQLGFTLHSHQEWSAANEHFNYVIQNFPSTDQAVASQALVVDPAEEQAMVDVELARLREDAFDQFYESVTER